MKFIIPLIMIITCLSNAQQGCDPRKNACCIQEAGTKSCAEVSSVTGAVYCRCNNEKKVHNYYHEKGDYCSVHGKNSEVKCCQDFCKENTAKKEHT